MGKLLGKLHLADREEDGVYGHRLLLCSISGSDISVVEPPYSGTKVIIATRRPKFETKIQAPFCLRISSMLS